MFHLVPCREGFQLEKLQTPNPFIPLFHFERRPIDCPVTAAAVSPRARSSSAPPFFSRNTPLPTRVPSPPPGFSPPNVPDGIYTYEGSDAPDVPGNNGYPKNNVFTNNIVSNVDVGVALKEGEDNEFIGESFFSSMLDSRPVPPPSVCVVCCVLCVVCVCVPVCVCAQQVHLLVFPLCLKPSFLRYRAGRVSSNVKSPFMFHRTRDVTRTCSSWVVRQTRRQQMLSSASRPRSPPKTDHILFLIFLGSLCHLFLSSVRQHFLRGVHVRVRGRLRHCVDRQRRWRRHRRALNESQEPRRWCRQELCRGTDYGVVR